jgi:hypothetical protein
MFHSSEVRERAALALTGPLSLCERRDRRFAVRITRAAHPDHIDPSNAACRLDQPRQLIKCPPEMLILAPDGSWARSPHHTRAFGNVTRASATSRKRCVWRRSGGSSGRRARGVLRRIMTPDKHDHRAIALALVALALIENPISGNVGMIYSNLPPIARPTADVMLTAENPLTRDPWAAARRSRR